MWTRFFLAPAAAATILAASPDLDAAGLKPKMVAAFDRYVKEGIWPDDWAGDVSQDGQDFGERV